MNIVIPMAGRGSRFADAGYTTPKPLIPVLGKPMIQWVIENIKTDLKHQFIFICQEAHIRDYDLDSQIRKICHKSRIISVKDVTDGALRTVLCAKDYINNDSPLTIANCDQFVDINFDHYLKFSTENTFDGVIMTMPASDPKWSYVRKGKNGYIDLVVEKQVISSEATTGIYNFRTGRDFISAAEEIISRNCMVNNEFYVAPVFNILIERGGVVASYNIGEKMHGLGTPHDLQLFEATYRNAK
ncbi:glycosyltransferase family 2 protein [Chitinilyticum litopenaei]|uniref:glycosyltransferase family 2 protein n=1 Tax=Chitinilyticum litopenaei TaxID=1121276 RepID=UPI001B7F99AD|nr:glycosyltransferase family 2 protein [Chitinilyticum litopenaei]